MDKNKNEKADSLSPGRWAYAGLAEARFPHQLLTSPKAAQHHPIFEVSILNRRRKLKWRTAEENNSVLNRARWPPKVGESDGKTSTTCLLDAAKMSGRADKHAGSNE